MNILPIIVTCYLFIGFLVSMYFSDKCYEKQYEEAKKSEDGVEEGMVVLCMLFLVMFWPFAMLYKFSGK